MNLIGACFAVLLGDPLSPFLNKNLYVKEVFTLFVCPLRSLRSLR